MFFCLGCFIGWTLCRDRFTARGQERSRRGGLGLSRISSIASRVATARRRGGKSRLPGNLAADDAECAYEGHPVRIKVGLVGGFSHQVPDSVMGEQQSPDFLLDQFGLAGSEDD